ncbi:F-box protein interaction domain protein [Medicago truncatula]|uniref:F-box protein interaction domain protein n=1 Tax=Medicago truncatula TaxID=3880 RepID=G7KFD8_MEDTR|nr:F-box protein interaction domain protein [Medicago truncatula]
MWPQKNVGSSSPRHANDIWKKLNLFYMLKAQGISPSTSSKPHLRADFENAISKHLGFTLKVQFHCPSNELLEIRLCRNRGGNQYEWYIYVLWNPSTTEFTVIPTSPNEFVPPYQHPSFKFHGFGYDRVRDDYKVIRYTSFSHVYDEDEDVYEVISYDPLFEVFSLRSKSWSILDVDVPKVCYELPPGVYTNGVCHWWSNSSSHDKEDCLRCLVVLNESIALISNCPNATTFHISILGELGVKKLWIKLFIVGPIPFIHRPIGVGKKGNICFKKKR